MVYGAYHVAIHIDDGAYGPWVIGRLVPSPTQQMLVLWSRSIDLLQAGRFLAEVEVATKWQRWPAWAVSRGLKIRLRRFDRILVETFIGLGAMSLDFPGIEVVRRVISRSFIVSVSFGEFACLKTCVWDRRGTFDDFVHSFEWEVSTWRHILLANMTLAILRESVMNLGTVVMDLMRYQE